MPQDSVFGIKTNVAAKETVVQNMFKTCASRYEGSHKNSSVMLALATALGESPGKQDMAASTLVPAAVGAGLAAAAASDPATSAGGSSSGLATQEHADRGAARDSGAAAAADSKLASQPKARGQKAE